MPQSLLQKLKIQEGYTLLAIDAPIDFREKLGSLPPGVRIVSSAKRFDQVHCFAIDRTHLENQLNTLLNLPASTTMAWIYFPKGSSKIKTDLSRDTVRNLLAASGTLQLLTLVSFDDDWSAFSVRPQLSSTTKPSKPEKTSPDLYIDRDKRTVTPPPELQAALDENPKALAVFNQLAFTHKKEYVEWIIDAKKPETKDARIQSTIQRLAAGWKNPRNQ